MYQKQRWMQRHFVISSKTEVCMYVFDDNAIPIFINILS